MSSGNGNTGRSAQMDTKREEFRKYLEKEGVLEYLTKSLVSLYEADKPNSALDYLKNNFSGKETEILQLKVSNLTRENDSLTKENTSLKDKVSQLESQLSEQQKKHQEQLAKERAVAAEASAKAASELAAGDITAMAIDQDTTTPSGEKSSGSVAPASTVGGGRGADAEDEPMDTQDNEAPAAVKQAASTSSKPPVDQSTARKPEEPKPSPTEETSATALAVPDGEKSSESKPSEVAPKAPEEPLTAAAPPAMEVAPKAPEEPLTA